VQRLVRLESVTRLIDDEAPPQATAALVGDMKVLIPLAGLIDKDAELARLDKEIRRYRKDCEQVENKLANENFVNKAPAAVVEQQHQRLDESRKALARLEEQAEKIRAL
jgi:valyl-tRNA synthetase